MRSILFAYFDYMHSIGWLSTRGTITDYIVAVVPPTLVVMATAYLVITGVLFLLGIGKNG